jgi:hypothetical protein
LLGCCGIFPQAVRIQSSEFHLVCATIFSKGGLKVVTITDCCFQLSPETLLSIVPPARGGIEDLKSLASIEQYGVE